MRPSMRAPSIGLGLLALLVAQAAGPATAAAAAPDFPDSMSGYHNYPEMVAEIQQAEIDFPDIVDVFSIGKSYQGRDIWAAKISDNVAEDEDEPEVLIDALHHAREHLTTEQALATLRWLTQDYGTDETVTRLVDNRETYLIFALNPDGMQFDLTGDPFRAWRKNRQPNPGPTVGTDLNRNYAYRFGCCHGSSGAKKSLTYRGAHPFSAPETRAMRDFVQSRVVHGVQQIRTHITLHTNGQLILWPYGYTKRDVPPDMTGLDHQAFVSLGKAMARTNGYKAEQSSDLYITDGDQIDWLYARYRIFTYTFELFPAEKATVWGDHYPDDSKIAGQTARNREAILLLIDRAACPYATPRRRGAHDWTAGRCTTTSRSTAAGCATRGTTTRRPRACGRSRIRPPRSRTGRSSWAGRSRVPARSSRARRRAGTSGSNDVDHGVTSMRSRPITLPADAADYGRLTFWYSFAHSAASTDADFFRVQVQAEDGTRTTVFERLGAPTNVNGSWRAGSASLADWAGQTIRLVVGAKDGGPGNLLEAQVDNIRIRRP